MSELKARSKSGTRAPSGSNPITKLVTGREPLRKYVILPDGDGEFSLTVAPGWQGWGLGSNLLDILVAAAAARGVPNLQADIMLDNTRMLALLSQRGYLTLDRYGLREARVAIAAAQPARGGPCWRSSPAAADYPQAG